MLRSGTLTPYMARFLEAAVLAKLNILIAVMLVVVRLPY